MVSAKSEVSLEVRTALNIIVPHSWDFLFSVGDTITVLARRRLWHLRRLENDTALDETWEDNDCYGHSLTDIQPLFNLFGDPPTDGVVKKYHTNQELYELLRPDGTAIPYMYDNFQWPHCSVSQPMQGVLDIPRTLLPRAFAIWCAVDVESTLQCTNNLVWECYLVCYLCYGTHFSKGGLISFKLNVLNSNPLRDRDFTVIDRHTTINQSQLTFNPGTRCQWN